ncbi:MFS transporter [Zemynaea arenosa]|uniref:MFS transporter n=1 Tax=Zemynaea arenosa TaxID=2561931 RepID=UPI001E5C09E3|nr:MFS transporter [Massilia arenosa]
MPIPFVAYFKNLLQDPLLESADFRRYWLVTTLNDFGAQITTLAMPLCAVLLLHASAAEMGTLSAMQALPFALFGLPSGVLLDRYRRLPILLASKATFGLALASVPLAWWLGWLSMPWMYVVGFLMGTVNVVGGSAEQVFVVHLVGRERMTDAQSKIAASDSVSRLLGPGLGGILIQVLSAPVALLLDALTFFYAIFSLRRMGVTEAKPEPTGQHPLKDMAEGLKYVWQHEVLRPLAWMAGIWHILFYGYLALSVIFATRVLGLSPGQIGVAQMLGGVGVLASSILLKPLTRKLGAGGVIVGALASMALVWTLMPLLPRDPFGSHALTVVAYGALVFIFDCGVMLFFMPYVTMRQRVTPDAFLGRMISTMRFVTVATAPVGAFLAGAVGEQFGVRTGLACIAVVAIALTVWVVGFTSIRRQP